MTATGWLRDRSESPPWEGPAQVVAKAATGPGVGFYSAGHTPLASRDQTPQAIMKRAQMAYHHNTWVGTAESVITRKVVGLPWHLEDGDDEEYDDKTGVKETPEVKEARQLIERPQLILGNLHPGTATRRLMTSLTSRHLGLCGMTHWFGDQMNAQGIPVAWLYVNPARMWAFSDERGNLEGWVLDATGVNGKGQPYGGVPLELSEVMTFYLDPPDHGHYGTGWYERAMLKAQLSNLADQHAGYVLGTGGRIAGIVSPKEGSIPDEKFNTLVREFRNVNEAPDAAKRTTIMQGPTDFTATAANPEELGLVELSKMTRDDIFTAAGVPNSQAGVETPAGLNSGSTKTADEAVLMQGPVHDRVLAIKETLQYGWLDKYLPTVIELVIEEPEFDDDTPAYERLAKASGTALTNEQRWEIIGIPPTGDDAIDKAILLPSTLTVWATAPGAGGGPGVIEEVEPTVVEVPVPVDAEDEVPEGKAAPREFLGIRRSVDQRMVPAVRKSLAQVLKEQRSSVVAWVRSHADHLQRKPTDTAWWNTSREDDRLAKVLRPAAAGITQTVTKRVGEVLEPQPKKAEGYEERLEAEILQNVGLRIKGINKVTRDRIAELISDGFADGLSPAQVADSIEASTWFNELRAETIARTETMFAYNAAALGTYAEYGVEKVEPLDGDEDPECIARMERGPVTLEEALADEDHPNGTLDWAPYFGKAHTKRASDIARPEPLPVIPPPAAAPHLDIPLLIRELASVFAAKAEPVAVHVVNGEVRTMRTVIDRDAETGRVIGSHEEYVDAR